MNNLSILKNYLLYILTGILICMVGISDVFAWRDYANPVELRDVTQQLVSTDYLSAPVDNPLNGSYAFRSVLQVDYIIDNYNFSANTNYQLESHLGNQQFTNVNAYSVSGLNGESCIISYTNSILNDDAYPRWAFQCPHSTNTVTISIYNTNNSYLWSGTAVFSWLSAVLWTSPTSLPTQSTDTDQIINNQNQNTQLIINNQNQNAQDIIDNQNENTQDLIDSNKVCKSKVLTYSDTITNGLIIDNQGTIGNSSTWGVTDYLEINKLEILSRYQSSNGFSCFYNNDKTLISCIDVGSAIGSVNLPNGTKYARFSIRSNDIPEYKVVLCENGNQALDNTLTDDDIGNSTQEAADFITDFNTNTFGLTSIITAPLNLIQSLTSSTCTALHLPLPYLNNKYLDLPCMTTIYQTHFGAFFTMYQTITYGIIAYWVIVRIFNQVKDFKNPEHDEIEVVDL